MPKRKFISGIIDPISIIGVLFLIITLVVGTKVASDKGFSLNIIEQAKKAEKTGNTAYDKCREESGREVCNERLGTNVNWKGEIVNEIDTSNVDKNADPKAPTCDANGVQYSAGAVVMYGGIGSNATCGSDGKWDVGVGATIDIKPENVPEYAKGTDELKKAIETEEQAVQEQITKQVAVPTTVTVEPEQIGLTQSTNQTSGTTVVQQPAVTAVTTTTQVGQPCTNCHLPPTQQTQNSVQLPSQQTVAQVINLMNKDNPVPPPTRYAVINNKLVTGTVETNPPLRISLQSISDWGNTPIEPSADSVNKAKSLLDFITYNLNPNDNSVYTKISTETLLDNTKTTNLLGQPSTVAQDAINQEKLERTRNAVLTGLALSTTVLTGGTLIPFVADVGLPVAGLITMNSIAAATPTISALTVGGLTIGAVDCAINGGDSKFCKTAGDMAIMGYTGAPAEFTQMFNNGLSTIVNTAKNLPPPALFDPRYPSGGWAYPNEVIPVEAPALTSGNQLDDVVDAVSWSFIDDFGQEIITPSVNAVTRTLANTQNISSGLTTIETSGTSGLATVNTASGLPATNPVVSQMLFAPSYQNFLAQAIPNTDDLLNAMAPYAPIGNPIPSTLDTVDDLTKTLSPSNWVKTEMAKTNPNAFKNIGQDITTTFNNFKNGDYFQPRTNSQIQTQVDIIAKSLPIKSTDITSWTINDIPKVKPTENNFVTVYRGVSEYDSNVPQTAQIFRNIQSNNLNQVINKIKNNHDLDWKAIWEKHQSTGGLYDKDVFVAMTTNKDVSDFYPISTEKGYLITMKIPKNDYNNLFMARHTDAQDEVMALGYIKSEWISQVKDRATGSIVDLALPPPPLTGLTTKVKDLYTNYIKDEKGFLPWLRTPAKPVSEVPELIQAVSWDSVQNKQYATVADIKDVEDLPLMKGRLYTPQEKPIRDLYPVEVVTNLFFSEKSADSGRKLVQDYLQALKNGENVSRYEEIAKSFLNAQEKVYDTQSQSANSKLASWISRNYKGVDVNSLPTENIDDLALVRVMSSPDPIGVDPYGNVVIQSTFLGNPQKDAESVYRTSKHFTVNGAVAPVQTAYGRVADWSAGDVIVITPMNEFIKINGTPNTFAVQDTWWTPGTYDNLVLPKGTVLIIKDGSEALKEYANLPGVLIIKSENPYRSSRGVLEKLGYQYKAQGTEYSEANTPEEVFLNESVFAYNIGANSGLHFNSPTMNVGNELAGRFLENEVTNEMTKWSNGDLSEHQRLNTTIDLIKDGYFSHEPINGLYIPPEDIPDGQELTTANFDGFTSPLTNSQIKAVEDIISNEKLTLPNYWENQGIATKYQQLIKDSFIDPTLGTGLPLLKPELFGLAEQDANFLRQNVNDTTKTTIPVSEITTVKTEIVPSISQTPPLTGFAKVQEQAGIIVKNVLTGSAPTGVGLSPLKYVAGGIASTLFLDDYYDWGLMEIPYDLAISGLVNASVIYATNNDQELPDILIGNPNQRPYDEIMQEAIDNYTTENPDSDVYYSSNPQSLSLSDIFNQLFSRDSLNIISSTSADKEYNKLHFSGRIMRLSNSLLTDRNAFIDSIIGAAGNIGLFTKEGGTYPINGFDNDVKNLVILIEEKSQNTGRPVSHSFVIEYFLKKNNGDLAQTILDASNFEEFLVRSLDDEIVDEPYVWIQNHILDEYSPLLPYETLPVEEAKLEDSTIYYDYSLPNRLGEIYHAASITALLQYLPPEMIRAMVISEYLSYGDKHGLIKLSADLEILKELDDINNLLNSYK